MSPKPLIFPGAQVNGEPLKSITQVLLDRRATPHFQPDPVPAEYLDAVLQFAAQAPSGFNLQPWRFVVVRDPENRKRLQGAAMNQAKIGEAPVIVIAFAVVDEWQSKMDEIFQEGVRRGTGKAEEVEGHKQMVKSFVNAAFAPVWLNRQTMIAVTTMMLVAEAYGLDTAPMEGFDPEAVKREFALPESAVVIALLAIGFGSPPDKVYGGRLSLTDMVFQERYGQPWNTK